MIASYNIASKNQESTRRKAGPRGMVLEDKRPKVTQLVSSFGRLLDNRLPTIQRKPNHSGLPDNLKTGIENMSGYSMDDVKVHYNSAKPAQLNAHAYAQGTDIHLASGQEKHLPHEAWHVVQQKQGRVKPTRQLKASSTQPGQGVNINDDAGLEKEADEMGEKAVQPREVSPGPLMNGRAAGIVQRKISFSGFKDTVKAAQIFTHVQLAIFKNEKLLRKVLGDRFEEISNELTLFKYFSMIFNDMVRSPIEYGNINLNNPQHVVMFVKDAGKYLMNNYQDQHQHEHVLRAVQNLKEDFWKIDKAYSPDPSLFKGRTFKTAILGNSASVAYYLAANGKSLQPNQTVLIGKSEPWNPYDPKGRGITFVNHPMHMISPDRSSTQLPDRRSGADETFEGNAYDLVYQSRKVMARYRNQYNANIIKVSRERIGKWYHIETSKGTFFAQKVVAGLGIGPHAAPKNKLAGRLSAQDKIKEKKRVMDLDAFQREIKNPFSSIRQEHARKGYLFVGVAGPNAGVDAVFEATKLGMYVEWVVTGGPAVAEGMGNKISKKGLVDLYFDYLNGWTISGNRVKMDLSGKWRDKPGGPTAIEQQHAAESAFIRKNPGWFISHSKSAIVDYMVYAQGPDVGKIYEKFDESVTGTLGLKYDTQGRVGHDDSAQDVRVSTQHSDYNVYWEGIFERVTKVLGNRFLNKWKVADFLKGESLHILGVQDFANIPKKKASAIGLASEDGSFEIIGGTMIRLLNEFDKKIAARDKNQKELASARDLREYLNLRLEILKLEAAVPAKLRSGKTSAELMRTLETLSTPTIIAGDQLTPIRTKIEALAESIPAYVGSEESNFVTDDQTMIAAQIASYYANIPGTLANWVTQKIIEDRHENGVRPGTTGGGRAFMDKWNGKLERLQILFSRNMIARIAELVR